MKGDIKYRGWVIWYSSCFGDYRALHDTHLEAAGFDGKTIKAIKAKIRRHIERWGW